jgi:Ca2+-binding EF-hand superfamily protein
MWSVSYGQVEKKLRRAARAMARQGLDIESLFKEYDPEGTGALPRSDLVLLLMEMGLSLVDRPGQAYADGERLDR